MQRRRVTDSTKLVPPAALVVEGEAMMDGESVPVAVGVAPTKNSVIFSKAKKHLNSSNHRPRPRNRQLFPL